MLQNRYGWFGEFRHQVRGRVNIQNIVKREIFAVKFFEVLIEITV